MKLLALSCNRWNFLPPSLFGDKVNGFLKGRADRVAELAKLVPSGWLLEKCWVWIGMGWEGAPGPFCRLLLRKTETGHGYIH